MMNARLPLRDRLAFSTNAFTNGQFSCADAIREIAAAGFRAVELLADRPHLYMHRNDFDRQLTDLQAALRETGLRVVNVNANTASGYYGERDGPPGQTFGPSFTSVPADFPEMRRVSPCAWRVDYSRRCVELAARFGCRDVAIASGFVTPRGDPLAIWEQTRQAYAEVCEFAARHMVRINIEYEPDMLLDDGGSVLRMIDEVGAANLGVNFDIGHSYCLGEDVCAMGRRIGARLHTTHVEDLLGPTPALHIDPGHLIPGDGHMPLREILASLEAQGFEGYHIVELYTYGRPGRDARYAARESFRRLTAMTDMIDSRHHQDRFTLNQNYPGPCAQRLAASDRESQAGPSRE
ncbi:MAG: sugar phosphate isomerase/epimerase [Phycisphaerales bacterium]|nr:sugar phosphate isomerase/epimerase [Phycisphaerales bacterium]